MSAAHGAPDHDRRADPADAHVVRLLGDGDLARLAIVVVVPGQPDRVMPLDFTTPLAELRLERRGREYAIVVQLAPITASHIARSGWRG